MSWAYSINQGWYVLEVIWYWYLAWLMCNFKILLVICFRTVEDNESSRLMDDDDTDAEVDDQRMSKGWWYWCWDRWPCWRSTYSLACSFHFIKRLNKDSNPCKIGQKTTVDRTRKNFFICSSLSHLHETYLVGLMFFMFLKGTLMQIWKSADIFIFTWK